MRTLQQKKINTRRTWSLCFFNNKGGVGKTTLACNIASYLAEKENLNVLLIDADPQCNATQLILPEGDVRRTYSTSLTSESGDEIEEVHTLKNVLSPMIVGEATLRTEFKPIKREDNRFLVDLLPGHPQVALLEDKLSRNWSDFLARDLGGARVTNWNTQLLRHLDGKYDLIIYDVGPSLGALNRAVLIGVDFFLAPMGCDIFSLIGVENIARWLQDWQEVYVTALAECSKAHKEIIHEYDIRTDDRNMCRFLGYTVQQYITKTIRKQRRATGAYEEILKSIPEKITTCLGPLTANCLDANDLALGDVPHMYSLVPLAQSAHAPIHRLTAGDGLSGGQYGQLEEYQRFIDRLAKSLHNNLKRTRRD